MNGLTIRFLQNKNFIEDTAKGIPTFKKGFTKEELLNNTHYYNRAENVIVQVNSNYSHINCHNAFFQSSIANTLTQEDFLEIIKNIVSKGVSFFLTSLDDECEEFLSDNRLVSVGNLTKEEYLSRLEEEFDYIYPELYSITLNTDKEKVYLYSGGTISYMLKSRELPTEKDYLDMFNYLGSFNTLLDNPKALEKIEMSEKVIVNHPLSELHLLVDYVKENKDSLPKDLQDALNKGLEKELNLISDKHKNKTIYGK